MFFSRTENHLFNCRDISSSLHQRYSTCHCIGNEAHKLLECMIWNLVVSGSDFVGEIRTLCLHQLLFAAEASKGSYFLLIEIKILFSGLQQPFLHYINFLVLPSLLLAQVTRIRLAAAFLFCRWCSSVMHALRNANWSLYWNLASFIMKCMEVKPFECYSRSWHQNNYHRRRSWLVPFSCWAGLNRWIKVITTI